MLRPRAWNMIDQAVMVDGKKVPGNEFCLFIYYKMKCKNVSICAKIAKIIHNAHNIRKSKFFS
jgi:hypothetical protein